jgi:ligand-binding sensor domain-containing protein
VTKVFTRSEGLPSDHVLSVAIDGRWDVWIGSKDKGIARYDGEKWIPYGPVMGFSGRTIPVIAVDLGDNKWFNSEQGVFKFDGRRFSIVSMPIYR